MSKVLVLHYSTYGHTAHLAAAVAEGARSVSDTEVVVKRVPELMPAEVAEKAGAVVDPAIDIASPAELTDYDAIIFGTPTRFGNMAAQMRNFLDQTGGICAAEVAEKAGAVVDSAIDIASPAELTDYDAIIFGTPTRFGNMAAQMRNFLDQTGGIWMNGGLIGKVASVFVSTGTGGGNETTITSFHTTLFHHGMIVVGLPYSTKGLTDLSEVRGGSPLGAGTIAGADGSRQPSETELELARFQGRHVATVSAEVIAGRRSLAAQIHSEAVLRSVQ